MAPRTRLGRVRLLQSAMRWARLYLWFLIAACSKSAEPHGTPRASAGPPAATTAARDALEVSVAGLTWSAPPKPLVARTPKTQIRAAEYAIEGDLESELLVFYFGPDQRDRETTLLRWAGQFKRSDGSDAEISGSNATCTASCPNRV
jgi:hypothetical protein